MNDKTRDTGEDKDQDQNEFTKEELEGLSETERAAIESGDDETGDLRAIAGEDDEDEGDDEGSGDEGAEDDAAGDGAKDKNEKGEDKGKTTGTDEGKPAGAGDGGESVKTDLEAKTDDDDDDFVTEYKFQPVEKYEEQIATLATEREGVLKKFEDGDLTNAEMMSEMSKIDEKRDLLRDQHNRAVFAEELNDQNMASSWQRAQTKFYGKHPEYAKDEILFTALNGAVKRVAADAKVNNEDISFNEVMRRAHTEVSKRFKTSTTDDEGAGGEGGDQDKGKGKEAKGAKPPARKPDLKTVPRTLGNLPAAGDGDDDAGGGGEFAHIDKLSGMDLESALARLTPEQEQRYLRSSTGRG